ncbi:hypothetical protein DAPPUDRAFT_115635 [Daphnia pulex]|uniref:Uncharacterized protein n=1 Tax=Daphnia pulex TaxID=6669 RepID=E9HM23_DAPPU|nr:hypothetical protein DAPPUDRAFT_115635 [Daphnia pulex]|eukprot:EFX67159.1 hypothetical protein DAPPUDRAFT_115635 [Daphnia pulex]
MQISSTLIVCWAGILLIGSVEAFFKKDFGRDATSFVTSVSTVTVTSTEKSICAKLVNVTAACRRRRNFEFERPEILTFDEDIDEAVDLAFRNSFYHKQFAPTKTLSMEVTPLAMLPHSGRLPSNLYPGLGSSYPMYSSSSRNKSPVIHPSLYQEEAKLQQQRQLQQQQQRIFFSALSLANLFNKGTVTFTTFKTETKTKVKTSQATFFVRRQGSSSPAFASVQWAAVERTIVEPSGDEMSQGEEMEVKLYAISKANGLLCKKRQTGSIQRELRIDSPCTDHLFLPPQSDPAVDEEIECEDGYAGLDGLVVLLDDSTHHGGTPVGTPEMDRAFGAPLTAAELASVPTFSKAGCVVHHHHFSSVLTNQRDNHSFVSSGIKFKANRCHGKPEGGGGGVG